MDSRTVQEGITKLEDLYVEYEVKDIYKMHEMVFFRILPNKTMYLID